MSRSVFFVALSVVASGCGSDPLSPVTAGLNLTRLASSDVRADPRDDDGADPRDDGGADPRDDGTEPRDDDAADPRDDDAGAPLGDTPDEADDDDAGAPLGDTPDEADDDDDADPLDDADDDSAVNGGGCRDGASRASWRDTLPQRPTAPTLPTTLTNGDGAAQAGCTGEPTLDTAATGGAATARQGHASGRFYFEVTPRSFTPGWASVGVFASPASPFDVGFGPYFQEAVSAAGGPVEDAVMGVAVDLDAGVVGLYADGALRAVDALAHFPGVGAYFATAQPMPGTELTLNLGAAPFAFAPPTGFSAWSTNERGAAGPCVTTEPAPAPRAPITIREPADVAASTFSSSVDADTELVVLGAYDTGSAASWRWNLDDAGNPVAEPVAGGQPGSALVTIRRPGPIALVLTAYEPTDWVLDVDAATQLRSVSVYGMHAQTVRGVPDGVVVDNHAICADRNGGGNCTAPTGESFPVAAHQWPFDTGGGDTQGFIRFVEEQLCLPLKHFGGAYLARHFTLD